MLAKFPGLNPKGPYLSLEKEKENFCVVITYSIKAGEWNWEVSWRSRATTAKKCTKRCDARAQLVFCQSKPVNQKFCYHSNVTSHFSTLYCCFAVDVTAAMLVIRNKSITLLWEVKPAFESVEEILRRDYSNESQSSTFRRHCLRCIRRFQI